MQDENGSLDRISSLLKKINDLLKENGAYINTTDTHTETISSDNWKYRAIIEICLD